MSGRYAINAATHFPGPRQGRRLDLRHASGHRPARQPASCRQKTKAELYFGCAETDIYAPQEIIDKVKQAMKAMAPMPRSRSIPAPITASPFRSGRSIIATPPSGTGSGCWRSIAATSRHKPGADALPHHRLSGVRSDRDRDRADRDPLVCAGLYRRHRAGLDLCALADQERKAVGRAGADLAAAARRFHPLGHARHHPRRPHRLCAVLQSPVLHRSIRPRSSNCGRAACRSTAASSAASRR